MKNNTLRDDIIKMIVDERLKQLSDPNSSNDKSKTKNDWTARIGYYLFETSSKPDKHVSFEEFRDSLIKAAAIILAALETSFSHDDNIEELLTKLESENNDGNGVS